MDELRTFMFKRVYEHANTLIQENAGRMLRSLYNYFIENPDDSPPPYDKTNVPRAACDYISSMTDQYAINVFRSLFLPREGFV